MGLELDLAVVLKTIRRPVGPLIGMVCQFGLMPLSSYFLGKETFHMICYLSMTSENTCTCRLAVPGDDL